MSEAALEGVARTALWTLHCRASYAARGVLEDPEAERIAAGLDAQLLARLGPPNRCFADRAAHFDAALRRYLAAHPEAPVVSLGEGLETQRFRVQGYGRWTSVDLPEVLAVRERFIAADVNHTHIAGSATDHARWWPALGEGPAFVVAQGLFMYLDERDVSALVEALADRGEVGLVFDVVPPWLSALSRFRPPMSRGLRVPRMPWGTDGAGLRERLRRWAGPGAEVTVSRLDMPGGPLPIQLPTAGATVTWPVTA